MPPPPGLPGYFGAPTKVPPIHAGLNDYLAATIPSMTTDRVFSSVWDDEVHLKYPPADRFITTFGRNFPVDQTDVLGGGNINSAFDAEFDVKAFTRVEADIEGRSIEQLREMVTGVYDLADQIITALQMWPGPTATGTHGATSILRRPARIKPGWRVEKKTMERQRWVVITSTWELSFVADLGNAYAF